MSDPKLQRGLDNFGRALERPEEALAMPGDDAVTRDVAILRFVLVYETAWKALRQFLAAEKIEARYPKEAFRQAYQAGWLERETPWVNMLDDRNLVAHTYNEATAIRIHEDIKTYLTEFRQAYACLVRRFAQSD
jgi:nucleotidyltransferase substrate binding protein (TIGR01987 family)